MSRLDMRQETMDSPICYEAAMLDVVPAGGLRCSSGCRWGLRLPFQPVAWTRFLTGREIRAARGRSPGELARPNRNHHNGDLQSLSGLGILRPVKAYVGPLVRLNCVTFRAVYCSTV